MINPKYDPNNYIKHLTIPVITDNQKIDRLFRSYLLRVKWWHNPLTKQSFNNVGTLRVHVKTPFGKLRPQDYQLQVDTAKDVYIQFVTLSPSPEFEYEVEVIQPVGMTRSMLEIWEYAPDPKLPNQLKNMAIHQPKDDSQLIAALAANTSAVVTSALAEELDTETILYSSVSAKVSSESKDNRGVSITTETADRKYRIYVGDNLLTAPNFADSGYVVELTGANAVYELDNGEQSNVWVVADGLPAVYSCTRTFVKSVLPQA